MGGHCLIRPTLRGRFMIGEKRILTMKERAQYYFGMMFHGLNIDRCDYEKFSSWYEENYDNQCTQEIYECACYIWDTCSRR